MKNKLSYAELETRVRELEEQIHPHLNYKAIFENSPEVIVFVNPEGIVQDVNQRVEDWLQFSPDEIRGKRFTDLEFMDKKTRELIREKFLQRLKGEVLNPYTIEVRGKDGVVKIGQVVARPILDKKGAPLGSLTLISDITRQYEQILKFKDASERNLALFRAVPDMIFVTDRRGIYIDYKAEKAEELLLSRDQIIGKNIDETGFPPRILELLKSNMDAAFRTGEVQVFEYELETPGGKATYECRMVLLNENELISVIRNITQRKSYEQELRLKNRVFESGLTGNSISDAQGVITYVNNTFLHFWGYEKKEELIGKHIRVLVQDENDAFNAIDSLTDSGEWNGEFVARRKDGSTFISQGFATEICDEAGGLIGYQTTNLDISDKKKSENALLESERKYRALFEDNVDAVFIFDLQGAQREVNQKVLDMFRYSRDELIGRHISMLVAKEEQKESTEKIEALLNGEILSVYERNFVRKDGTEFPGEINVSLVRDGGGNPIHFQSIVRDISLRKQAALDIEKRQNYLESFLNAIPEAVVALDSSHLILEWNPGAEKLFGYSEEEVRGRNIDDLITNPETQKEANKFTSRVLAGEKVYPQETVRFRKDGSRVDVLLSGSPINIRGELQGVVAIYIDISSQKKIEDELRKADKLESLALLAGGIAHDFNNILGSISVNIGLFKLSKEDPAKMRSKMSEVEFALGGARNLTRQLLAFSKGNAPVKKPADLAGLIKDTVNFSLSGSNVKCEMNLPGDLWQVEIDEGQIGQVIQNITINADQAMPEGGNLSVEAENVQGAALQGLPLNGNRYVKIEFRDQGIGISEQHLKNIFDPFFTTKQKGGGLGLSTSFSIVKNHEGIIHVDSELGRYTSFTLYLPALEKRVVLSNKEEQAVVKGSGKILLMDDDKLILGATGDLLKHIGYRVVTAEKGEKAVKLYKEAMGVDPFSAVILDLTIPDGMGGKETIAKLLQIDPALKAIASSGYSVDPIISDYKSFGFSGAIAKPYTIQSLAKTLKEVVSPS